jgi:tetratricopeptide (TPR) repeat protein
MMRDDLLVQLNLWHEEDEYQEIVDAIMEIAPEDRDYVLVSHLGRALNNLGHYEEGLQQFLTIAKEGQDDSLWHYRIGVSYYYLKQYDEALKVFEIADKMDPEDEDTLEFLDWCRRKIVKKPTAALFDFSKFWDDSEYAMEKYVSEPPTAELIASVEEELVFKLPAFYINMMKLHNGGIPKNTCYPIEEAAAVTQDPIAISAILGIGREKRNSLCGDLGSRFVIEHGGYPEIGVVICECPSAGSVVMLDYRSSGNDGEPEVVHVNRDNQYKITRLAKNFETFIRGLVNEEIYDTK